MRDAIDVIEQTRSGGGLNVVFSAAPRTTAMAANEPEVADVQDRLLTLVAAAWPALSTKPSSAPRAGMAKAGRTRELPPGSAHGSISNFFGGDAAAARLADLDA